MNTSVPVAEPEHSENLRFPYFIEGTNLFYSGGDEFSGWVASIPDILVINIGGS